MKTIEILCQQASLNLGQTYSLHVRFPPQEIMVGPKYQAKIPPLGSYIYQQERGIGLEIVESWYTGWDLHHWCTLGCAAFVQLTVTRTSYCGRLRFCRCRRWRTSWSMHRDLLARGGQQAHAHTGPWSEITNRWRENDIDIWDMEEWVQQPRCLDVTGHMCCEGSRCSTFGLFFSIILFASRSPGTVWTGEMQLQCRGGAETTSLQC